MLEDQLGLKRGALTLRMKEIFAATMEHKDTLATEMQKLNKEAKIPKRISQLIERRSKSLKLQKIL